MTARATEALQGRTLGAAFVFWGLAGTLASPALCWMLRRRVRHGKEIADRLGERRGLDPTPRPDRRLVWLHAASVGETVSLLPVFAALCRQDPSLTLLLTTGTVTAQSLAAERLSGAGLSDRVLVRFLPLDVPAWIGRFLDHWRPDLAVLVESELWPTLIAGCVRRQIPLALLNARLSAGSAGRWARVAPVAGRLLGAFTWISARSDQDAERLQALGARGVTHDRDLKQAAEPLPVDEAEFDRLRTLIGDRPVWLAASTHPGEEAVILRLHRQLSQRHDRLLTMIAPRHPSRGADLGALAPEARRRGLGQDPDPAASLWICDTLGELGLLYRLAGPVLIGNSLLEGSGPGGGHNPLEPARLGCALATGPRMQNFDEDVERMVRAGGLAMLQDEPAMLAWLDYMLGDPAACRSMAQIARTESASDPTLPDRLAGRLLGLLPV